MSNKTNPQALQSIVADKIQIMSKILSDTSGKSVAVSRQAKILLDPEDAELEIKSKLDDIAAFPGDDAGESQAERILLAQEQTGVMTDVGSGAGTTGSDSASGPAGAAPAGSAPAGSSPAGAAPAGAAPLAGIGAAAIETGAGAGAVAAGAGGVGLAAAGGGGGGGGAAQDTTAPLAPTVPAIAENANGGINAAEAASLGGTSVVVSLAGTNAVAGDTVTVNWGGQTVNYTLLAADIAGNSATVLVPSAAITAQGDGTFNVTARITDIAGNVGAASPASSVMVDTAAPLAPVAPVIAENAGGGINAAEAASLGGTPVMVSLASTNAVAGDTVTVNWGGQTVNYTLLAADIAGNSATVLVPSATITAQGDGSFNVTARITDIVGNAGTASPVTLVTVDTAAPAAPTPTLAADTGVSTVDAITNNGNVNIAGLEVGAVWQYSQDNGVTWTAGVGTSLALTGDGAKSVIVRQTDVAGNVSVNSAALTFTLDKTAPAFLDDSFTIGANASVTLTFNEAVSALNSNGMNVSLNPSIGTFWNSTVAVSITGITSPGTSEIITTNATLAATDYVRVDYNAATGTITDTAGNPLTTMQFYVGGSGGNTIDLTGYFTAATQILCGNLGNDTLTGSAGADMIIGGIGVDTMSGAAGLDTFVFAQGDSPAVTFIPGIPSSSFDFIAAGGADVITDFASLEVINLSGVSGIATPANGQVTDQGFFLVQGNYVGTTFTVDNTATGLSTLVVYDGTAGAGVTQTGIVLSGVTLAQINAYVGSNQISHI